MRRVDDSDEIPGGDSFLDIVANIVGILVLLVVVVGVRAGRQVFVPTPVAEDAESLAVIEQQIKEAARRAEIDKVDAIAVRDKVLAAMAEAERRAEDREAATLYVMKLRSELDDASNSLNDNDQRSLATHNAIAQTQLALDRLTREQIALASFEPPPEVKTVTVAPSPIVTGKVRGDSNDLRTFRLKDNRLIYVPIDELEDELSKKVRPPAINDASKRVTTQERIGPIEGFIADATLGWSVSVSGNRVGIRTDVARIVISEVTPLRGETADEAFGPSGYIASRLDLMNPETAILRILVYADSFETAPAICEKLRERGFRVAQSLKATGESMTFSTDGTRAVMQ